MQKGESPLVSQHLCLFIMNTLPASTENYTNHRVIQQLKSIGPFPDFISHKILAQWLVTARVDKSQTSQSSVHIALGMSMNVGDVLGLMLANASLLILSQLLGLGIRVGWLDSQIILL